MISEIIPETYDATGRRVSYPFDHHRGFHPTFPIGRYLSQPLTIKCQTIACVRSFLSTCKYVSDREQFGKEDYWQPPEDFEKTKKGDCEDFALWTWRQLLSLGYDARFVVGASGRFGRGHAWVEYFEDGRCFLLEPLASLVGTIPRLSTIRYTPKISVSWDGKTIKYFSHKKPTSPLKLSLAIPLAADYIIFWAFFWLVNFFRLPLVIWKLLQRNVFRGELWFQRRKQKY